MAIKTSFTRRKAIIEELKGAIKTLSVFPNRKSYTQLMPIFISVSAIVEFAIVQNKK